MLAFERTLSGRRILVTGHTGFKGGWLALWLAELGAEVHGISLPADTNPSLFDALGLEAQLTHHIQDIRDQGAVIKLIEDIAPEVVFHLAAQPLVRHSFDQPLFTFETNIMGTAYVLEACRRVTSTRAIVCVTTDKVYENNGSARPYRECDPLGGKDPYSASKAAAEIVASCFRQSLISAGDGPALATARGGNVIGGGDWSKDRIVPDLVRAIESDRSLTIRNPEATRPWQHVLTLCHGYLQLASGLLTEPDKYQSAWNFGPSPADTVTVRALLQQFERAWKLPEILECPAEDKPESQALALDSTKAKLILGWQPAWALEDTIARTAGWYQSFDATPADALELTRDQISAYRTALGAAQSKN